MGIPMLTTDDSQYREAISISRWMDTDDMIHASEYYLALMKKMLMCAITWMDLESILHQVRDTDECDMNSLICEFY